MGCEDLHPRGQEECLWPAAVDVISSPFKEAVASAVRDAMPAILQQVKSYNKAQADEELGIAVL